jgi:hypothetical protein
MPLYCWQDRITEKEVQVLRSIAEYNVLPLRDEVDMTDEEYGAARWVRQIKGIKTVGFAARGLGGKGYW